MATQLNIKDAETVARAKRVAAQLGTSVTAAVDQGLRAIENREAPPLPAHWSPEQRAKFDAVKAFVDSLPKGPRRTWAEIDAEFQEINAFAYEQ